MGLSIGLVLAGLALVVFCSEQLVKGTVGTARGFGASTFVVAVVFLGFDPENLAVGAAGAAQGAVGLAVGTVFGSAMVAITLALGLAALLAPMHFGQVPRQVLAVPAAAALLLAALALDGRLSRLDGAVLIACYAVALAYLAWLGRRGLDIRPSGEVAKELPKAERLGKIRAVGILVAALIGVVVASEMLLTGATDLLERFGLSQTLIGMTVLAFVLSVEELAREIPPALRGHPEIAVGNVVGSVLAFFALNVGVIALIRPLALDGPTRAFYLPVSVGAVLLVCALLATRRLPRVAGAVLIAVYVAFAAGGYLIYSPVPGAQ